MSKLQKRYQECNPIEKLWRWRYYFLIPYEGLLIWWYSRDELQHYQLSLGDAFSIATGLIQSKMNWYYTWEEVKTRLNYKKDNKLNP